MGLATSKLTFICHLNENMLLDIMTIKNPDDALTINNIFQSVECHKEYFNLIYMTMLYNMPLLKLSC